MKDKYIQILSSTLMYSGVFLMGYGLGIITHIKYSKKKLPDTIIQKNDVSLSESA